MTVVNEEIIVIIGGFRMPNGNASAVRCIGNARLFSELGYKVVIAGKVDKEQQLAGQIWYNFYGFPCLDIESVTSDLTKEISFMDEIEKNFDKRKIKALIAYNYPGRALNRLHRWTRINGCKMISDVTEWYAFEGTNFISALLRKLSTEFRMRYVNKRIGNIICSTNYISNYYAGLNRVIIPMIDENSFSNDKKNSGEDDASEIKREASSIKRFIYAGSPGLNFSKDSINMIMEAFRRQEGCAYQLDFYGFTREKFLARFPEFTEWLISSNQVRIRGRVPREEIEDALCTADFYVLYRPSTKVNKVGFSTKSMEAIAHAVPLISNDVNGDFSLYFTDGQALISKEGDFEAFVENIHKAVLMDKEEILSMKKNCIRHNPFDYRNYTNKVEEFMGRLV